jgi:hypothetical protein
MKVYCFTLLFALLVCACASAQDAKEDVIYLKVGTIYRGTIIEQIPNVSYKIEIAGGSEILIQADEVEKITKETKVVPNAPRAYTQEEWEGSTRGHRARPPRGYKDKGGFFQAQIDIQWAGGSARMIGGYKVNQYAMIGLGLGFGGVAFGANKASIGGSAEPYAGFYFPFFVYYSGDIIQKSITPFYALEIGYAMANNFNGGGGDPYYYQFGPSYTLRGGVMGSAGFGVRFYAGRKFVCSLSANLDIQDSHVTTYDPNQNTSLPPSYTYSSVYMLIPAFKIGLGFVR